MSTFFFNWKLTLYSHINVKDICSSLNITHGCHEFKNKNKQCRCEEKLLHKCRIRMASHGGRHFAPLVRFVLIPRQSYLALTPYCCVLSWEETNTRCIVFGLTRPGSSTRSTRLEAITITIIHQRYAYRVFIYHLISYSTDCGTYWDFLDRRLLLIRKLLNEEKLLWVLSGKVEVITSKVLLPQSWPG
jgi:hypothetical protein